MKKRRQKEKSIVSVVICVLLCSAVIITGFTACKDGTSSESTTAVLDSQDYTFGTTRLVPSPEKDKKVTISIPSVFLKENELADLDAYCEANGYISAEYDEKSDQVMIVMTQFTNQLLLVNIGMTVINNIYALVGSESYPYFTDVKDYESDFSKISILVDRKAYEADKTGSFLISAVGSCCLLYGEYSVNENPQCEVVVLDKDTGDVISTTVKTLSD